MWPRILAIARKRGSTPSERFPCAGTNFNLVVLLASLGQLGMSEEALGLTPTVAASAPAEVTTYRQVLVFYSDATAPI